MDKTRAIYQEGILRSLPSIDELLRSDVSLSLLPLAGQNRLTTLAREVVDELRGEISSHGFVDKSEILSLAETRLAESWYSCERSSIQRVINATGVMIHTNLGRAPYSDNAKKAISEVAAGYCTLEYKLETGDRGRRGFHVESMITELTGAEAALIVNNCAAATFLVLSVFASGGEVIVSRGELVEIGGDFRIPDVLTQSGAKLREIGTTNRTKIADFERAINENTSVILRVHPSNYRIVGFTSMPTVADLSKIAKKNDVLFYEDLGSGALIDLGKYGLIDEPIVGNSIRDGADIISFSGDKLLGGPQSGIIAGRQELIDRIRKHPLYRTLRVDKIVYAALEATLSSYRREAAFKEIPILQMLSATKDQITARTECIIAELRSRLGEFSNLQFMMLDGLSAVGGGAAPTVKLNTALLAVSQSDIPANELCLRLRASTPPVIGRVEDDLVLLDLRTVTEKEEVELINVLCALELR